jgi:hypothetical protein
MVATRSDALRGGHRRHVSSGDELHTAVAESRDRADSHQLVEHRASRDILAAVTLDEG